MIKTHNTTGLQYLCKTRQKDYEKYHGSGKYWKLHLKKHGYDISTKVLFQSNNLKEFSQKALEYSKILNVAESPDFANLKPENGLDGGDCITHLTNDKLLQFKAKQRKIALMRWKVNKAQKGKAISVGRLNMTEEEKAERARKVTEAFKTSSKRLVYNEKMKTARLGEKNPNAKQIQIESKVYNSIKSACDELGLTRSVITNRLNSKLKRWKSWIRL